MSRHLTAVIAAAVILGGGSYALHIYSQRQAVALVEHNLSALAGGGDADHGQVAYSILRDTVTVEDITVSMPVPGSQPVNIKISKLTMVGAAEDTRAGRVTADQLTLEGITATTRHPVLAAAQSEYDLAIGADRFSITDYAGPALHHVRTSLLRPEMETILSILNDINFKELTTANATLSAVNGLNSQSVALIEISLADFQDGLLRSGGAIGITSETAFRTSDGNDESFTLQMARTDHSGLNFGMMQKVLYPEITPLADSPRQELVGASSFSGIAISGTDGLKGKFGILEFKGIESRPLPLPLDELLQIDETTMSKEQSLDLFGSLVGVLQFTSAKLEDAYVESDAGEHLDLVSFLATEIGYTGFESLNVSGLAIANFPKDKDEQIDRIAIQSIELGGFQFEDFIPKMIPYNRLSKEDQREQVFDLVSTLPTKLQAKVIGFEASADGETMGHFDEYAYALDLDLDNFSGKFSAGLTGFDFASALFQDDDVAPSLARLGLDRLAGSMSMNMNLSEDGSLTYGPFSAEVQDLARVDASAQLVGLDVHKLLDQQQSLAAALAISLASFDFSYRDESLLQRGLESYAVEVEQTPDQVRNRAIETAKSILNLVADTPFGDQASAAIESFFLKPGTLRISALPEEPVTFTNIVAVGQIQPKAIPELLNLTVSAE